MTSDHAVPPHTVHDQFSLIRDQRFLIQTSVLLYTLFIWRDSLSLSRFLSEVPSTSLGDNNVINNVRASALTSLSAFFTSSVRQTDSRFLWPAATDPVWRFLHGFVFFVPFSSVSTQYNFSIIIILLT